jgi:anti-anti-sigma factor
MLARLLPMAGGEMNDPEFGCWIETASAADVVHVRGDIDDATLPRLASYLDDAAQHARHLIVDLSQVTYLNVASMSTIERHRQRYGDRGHMLVVVAPTSLPRRSMDMVGFGECVRVVESLDEAFALLP